MKLVGIVVDVDGKYFAKDKDGKVRQLKVGDKVYEGEKVYGSSADDRVVIESPQTNEKIQLNGLDEFTAGEFGQVQDNKTPEKTTDDLKENDQEKQAKTTTKSSDSSQSSQDPAVGFQEVFLARTGEIINVEASLLNAITSDNVLDNRLTQNTLAFNPPPTIITNISQVQDNFYDAHLPSGTDTANNNLSFEALSGLKTLTIGTTSLTQSELEAINTTPVSINMQAGILTLNAYVVNGYLHTVSYTYNTSNNYTHDINSDIFADTLKVVVTDIGGNSVSAPLTVNVIDDKPITESDVNSIQEGQIIGQIKGNVFTNDHIGADDESLSSPVVEVEGGSIGTKFYGTYGELFLKADGSYRYFLDNTNPAVKILVDGEVIHDIYTYTIVDGDGDKSTNTLDISVLGSSQDPILSIEDGSVDESALAIGTDPTSNTEIVTGTIKGIANDGFANLKFEASDGTTITIADLSTIAGQTINTPLGTLTLISYSESPHLINPSIKVGTVSYSYELTSPKANAIASDDFDDIITVTIEDSNGDTTSKPLTITIVDDKPLVVNDINMITEDAAEINTVSGNVLTNDNDGADTNLTPITVQVKNGLYGQFNLSANGAYTYTLNNDNPNVDALNDGDTLTDTLVYTITDADGDTTTANLDITINGITDPQLSVSDQIVSEDGLTVIFTISLDKISARDVSFDYSTLDGTALDGRDYTFKAGNSTITANALSTTVTVTLGADDYVSDDGKTFDLQISNVNSAGSILDAKGTATIKDDSDPNTPYDNADSVLQEATDEAVTLKLISVDVNGNATASNITEGESAYYKVLVLEADGTTLAKDKDGNLASGNINVEFNKAVSDTATGGVDYVNTITNVSVNTIFSVDSIDDYISDNGETFTLSIVDDTSYSNASDFENVIHNTTAVTTTITDDIDVTNLDLSGDSTVNENADANYTLTLSQNVQTNLTVEITLTHVDTVNADFTAFSVTRDIVVLAGTNSINFSIDIFDDLVYEGNEDYKISITNTSGGGMESIVVGIDEVTTTVVDNDTPQISIGDIDIQEDGTATFTVSSDIVAKNDMVFTYATSDGSATDADDYTAKSGTVTILAGQNSADVTITLLDDYISDDAETFNLTIATSDADINIVKSTGVATLNDNSKPNTPFDDTDTIENNLESVHIKLIAYDKDGNIVANNTAEEGKKAFYKVILVEDDLTTEVLDASGNLATGFVDIAYTNGTAIGGSAKTGIEGEIDFNNTIVNVEVNKIFSVDTFNDTSPENPNETFEVNIVDDTYTLSEAQKYENVITDTSKITTTIDDDTITLKDIVFVHILNDAVVNEADGALLTHTFEFRELDGTPVNLAAGAHVTITLNYTSDATNAADFQVKQTSVIITGTGTNAYTFFNVVADDFLNEGSESYTIALNSVTDDDNTFEALFPFSTGSVTGTINDESTPDTALVSISADQAIKEGDTSSNFLVSLDQPASDVSTDITVELLYSGVAVDGTDFIGVSSVTIAAGSNFTNFSIATIDDALVEGSENFTISIGNITDINFEAISANPSAASVTNTIIDNVEAHPDTAELFEGNNLVNTPNLLTNDEVGVNAQITSFTYTDEGGNLQTGTVGSLTDTQYGQITINADGTYAYTSDSFEAHDSSDSLLDIITYTITDNNADTSSSTLTIDVKDTIATITPNNAFSVDEDDLSNGSDAGNDSLLIDDKGLGIIQGEDPIEDVLFNLSDITSALSGLSSGGISLSYSLSPDSHTLIAKAGTQEIFVATLNQNAQNSTYDFELKGPLDHASSGEDTLAISIPFNVKEQGANEDVISSVFNVNIVDDVPTAIVEADDKTVVEGGTQISGNVLSNDITGADSAKLSEFTYKDTAGTNQTSTTFGVGVNTATGLLNVNENGSWTFTPNSYVDHDDAIQGDTFVGDGTDNDSTQGSFSYKLIDGDGDISNEVAQTIHVTDGANPIVTGGSGALDEDDIPTIGSDTTPESNIATGTLNVTTGSDPVDIKFTTANSGTLTSDGVNITYTLSADGYTLTAKAGSKEIFTATITDPTNATDTGFSFELKGPIDHDNASGQNTKDIDLVFEGTDIDGDSVTGPLSITITDDIPSIGTPDDGVTDEEGLPNGSATDPILTVTTGSLAILTEADNFDAFFDQNTIDTLTAKGIQADNPKVNVTYVLSNNGHTITASVPDFDVFSIEIINPNTINASYEFNLLGAIDHAAAGVTETFTFDFKVKDADGDETSSSFDVGIIDDDGTGDKNLVVNEDGSVTFGFTADAMSANDFITTHGKVTFDSATNKFTYTPDGDYSGLDVFDLTYSLGATSITETVTVDVTPISDKPILSVDDDVVDVDEDTAVALGLNAPIVKDDTDHNILDTAPNSTDGDNPERLGAITIEGLTNGTVLHYGSLSITLDGTDKTIKISDLDENGDGVNDHLITLLNGNVDFVMTKAEFESMQITPPLNSGDNLALKVKVTSYEVDDAGAKLVSVSGKTSSNNVTIDVHAKTDDGVAISALDVNGDEDNWIRVDDSITITPTLDVDGSEVYELVFSASALPSGSLYYTGTVLGIPNDDRTIGSDANGGFSIVVSDPNNIPPVYIMTPINDSSDIKNLEVTVNVHDTDSDSTPTTDIVKSASTHIDVNVTPVANDITVSTSGSTGDEDNLIDINMVFTNADMPLEKITSITIDAIPDGAIIYAGDGITIIHDNSAGGSNSVTINIPTGNTSAIETYKVLPPAHSSADITLQVSMTTKDFDDDGSPNTDTGNIPAADILITINPISETDSSDSANPSGNDIVNVIAHTYIAKADEDEYFNLNTADGGYSLEAFNEDAQTNVNGSTNPNGNEETFVVFTNVRYFDGASEISVSNDTFIKYNDGSSDIELSFSSTGEVKVPLEFLDTVQIKSTQDFSGTMKVDTFIQNQDLGDDAGDTASSVESSSVSTLVINVTPVIDEHPSIIVTNLNGNEDAGRHSDGSIDLLSVVSGIVLKGAVTLADIDDSEAFSIIIDDLPEDAALYYRGHIIYANSGNDFIADGIIVTDNGDNTFKVKLEELDKGQFPVLIPPHNSNVDITLKVSGFGVDTTVLEDGTVIKVEGPESTPIDMNISLKGVADKVVHTSFRTFDIDVDILQANGDKFIVTEQNDSSGRYNQIVQEDASGVGVLIALKDVYVNPALINSYDNIASNNINVSPSADTSVASELVNLTVTGLDAQFDLDGAILVNGTGIDRIYTFTLAQLQSGSVKVSAPEHYSGEIDLKIQYITTEDDGNSKTSNFEDIKILVTPKAEVIASIAIDTLEVNEDVLTALTFNLTNPLLDTNGNAETLYEVWINKSDVTGNTFTMFYNDGSSAYVTLDDAVLANADISNDGTFYHFKNGSFNDLAVQYDPDLGTGADAINVKYTFMDYIVVDGKTIENISAEASSTYDFSLNAVTDDIDAQGTAIHDDNGDTDISNVDGTGDVMSFKVLTDTQVTLSIDIDGVDMSAEVDPSTGTAPNTIDDDSSEEIVSIRIDGVPKGIGIEGGRYVGDIEDPGNPGVYTGIWYIDNPKEPGGGDMLLDANGTSYDLVLNIRSPFDFNDVNYSGHEVGGNITVSFINKDGTAASSTDSVVINIDDTSYNPSIVPEVPMDILEWNTTGNEDVIVEDTPITLGNLVNFSIDPTTVGINGGSTYNGIAGIANGQNVTSNLFSITVEGLENASVAGAGWNQDSSNGVSFYTFQGAGGTAEIQAALDALIITPNQDYNENHDTNVGDNLSAFNEGPLELTTTLTTYAQDGFSDAVSLNYSGTVTPVTDDIDIVEDLDFEDENDVSSAQALEDGTYKIDINITSVDDPYLNVISTDIRITNISPDNIGVIVADGSDESVNGTIYWGNSLEFSQDLDKNAFVDIPYALIDTVEFKLDQDVAGDVVLEYSIEVQEKGSSATRTLTDTVEFTVKPVADGLDTGAGVKIVGNEDEFMELTDNAGNSFSTLGSVDPTEEISSLVLEGVPDGYLVYIGNPGSEVLANNLGNNGSVNNSWTIDASGVIPRIWLKAPENIGGVSSVVAANWDLLNTIKLTSGVNDMGEQIFSTENVYLEINAVADDVTINPQNLTTKEGEDKNLVLNALVKDTDGSERLIVTLTGLGAFAILKLNGTELDASSVTYVGDTYTIDNANLDYDTIKQLSLAQNDFTGTITVGVKTVESSNGNESTEVTDTFTLSISQENSTSGDDILLFDLKGNDGLSGDDTLVFGRDWNSSGIDFTSLNDTLHKNVEILDLTQHGDHSITLNTTDIEAMIDNTNDLLINSDAGDSITIENDGDNVWVQHGTSSVYESINGAVLTINGAGTIDDTALDATGGDDILGYNNTTSIDAGAGDDRLIVFDGVEVDFTKVINVESIDFEVVGDHTISNLSVADVMAITGGVGHLKIFGDANDSVDFDGVNDGSGWIKGGSVIENAKTFDVYTNATDVSVEVKVQQEIVDAI